MHILHIYKDYPPVLGGIENHLKGLAEAQVQAGLRVTVLVTSLDHRTEVLEQAGVQLIKSGRLAHVASTPLSLEFFARLRALQVDIVHLHFPYPPGELGNLIFHPGRHTVITYHSDVIRQQGILRLYLPLLWRVLRQTDRIIATSPQYIQSSPYLSQLADKCVVIPLGIDPNPFQQGAPERIAELRGRYGQPLLLFVGRLRYYKGLQFLIEAMARVEARLLVVGTGPMEATWRTQAHNLGLHDRVIFLGEVADADLPAYYRACDVFVLPASHRSEAFGTVQLEAMAAGLPVVSTEVGTGTSYVNRHEETGLVVPPRDPGALAEAINHLLADPSLRARLGAQARARVMAEFTHAQMVERVVELYHTLEQS